MPFTPPGAAPAPRPGRSRAARRADRRDPYFGQQWIWIGSICAVWPGKDTDRYLGPFNRRTANVVLIVGNLFDPATRYQDAVSTARILARGRLLTVKGYGHPSHAYLMPPTLAQARRGRRRGPDMWTPCPVP